MTLRTARFRRRKTNFFFSCFPYLLFFSLFFSRPRPHPQSFQFPYETHQILHPRARLFLKMTCSVFYGEVINNRASNVLSLLWILTGRNEAYIIFYTDSLEGTDTLSSGVVMEVSIERNLIRQPATSFHPFWQERLVLATGTGASNVMILNNTVAQHCTLIFCSLSSAILMTFLALREGGWTCLIRTFFQLVILWLNQCQILQAVWMLDWIRLSGIFF